MLPTKVQTRDHITIDRNYCLEEFDAGIMFPNYPYEGFWEEIEDLRQKIHDRRRDPVRRLRKERLSGKSFADLGGAEAPYLGNDTESRNPPAHDAVFIDSLKTRQFARQEAARELIGGRLNFCGRVPLARDWKIGAKISEQNISISIMQKDNNYYYHGLMHCGNIWTCPSCSALITAGRRDELIAALAEAKAQGLQYVMLTLTVPHYANNQLKQVLIGISDALRKMKNRKSWKRFAESLQIVGDIRALEVTNGNNGWHPHFHIIIINKNQVVIEEGEKQILKMWKNACISVGLPLPNEHGVNLKNHDKCAEYIAKWGLSSEMAKGSEKDGSHGNCSPFQLLDLNNAGDIAAGEKFQEFAKEFKGKRQLVWSKGLKSLLKVKPKTDEEILVESENDDKATVFAKLAFADFQLILKYRKQAECLSICRHGYDFFREWLGKLRRMDSEFNYGANTRIH